MLFTIPSFTFIIIIPCTLGDVHQTTHLSTCPYCVISMWSSLCKLVCTFISLYIFSSLNISWNHCWVNIHIYKGHIPRHGSNYVVTWLIGNDLHGSFSHSYTHDVDTYTCLSFIKCVKFTNEMGISPNLHKQGIKGSYKDIMTQTCKERFMCRKNIYQRGEMWTWRLKLHVVINK
jgi:hypothetical protein